MWLCYQVTVKIPFEEEKLIPSTQYSLLVEHNLMRSCHNSKKDLCKLNFYCWAKVTLINWSFSSLYFRDFGHSYMVSQHHLEATLRNNTVLFSDSAASVVWWLVLPSPPRRWRSWPSMTRSSTWSTWWVKKKPQDYYSHQNWIWLVQIKINILINCIYRAPFIQEI